MRKLNFSTTKMIEDLSTPTGGGDVEKVKDEENESDDSSTTSNNSDKKYQKSKMCTVFRPEEIKEIIPAFNNNDISITTWIKKIEHYKKLYNWSEEDTLIYSTLRLSEVVV